MRWPSCSTTLASTLPACSTSRRSALATSGGETLAGNTSTARHTARIWSSPTSPACTAAASSGSCAGSGGPVSDRRGLIRAASLKRRVISPGVIRSRAHNLSRTAGTNPVSSGGSAISPKMRYIRPRLVRSWVSSRSAISTRNELPTRSDDVSRSTSWAASIASRAAPIRSRAAAPPTKLPTPQRYRTYVRTRQAHLPICG